MIPLQEYNNEPIESGALVRTTSGIRMWRELPNGFVLNCNFIMEKVKQDWPAYRREQLMVREDIIEFYEKVLNNTDKEQFWEQFTENVENHDDFEISFTKEHGWKLGDDIIKQFSEIWLELFEEMDSESQWVSVMIFDDDDDPAMRGECEADFSYWQRMKEHLIY